MQAGESPAHSAGTPPAFQHNLSSIHQKREIKRENNIFYSTIRPFGHSAIHALTFGQLVVLELVELYKEFNYGCVLNGESVWLPNNWGV